MDLKKTLVEDSLIVTYDADNDCIVSVERTEESKKAKAEATKLMLQRKEEFKLTGAVVVNYSKIPNWNKFINFALSNKDMVYYNGVIIEAALECMKALEQNLCVEEVYKLIDVQNIENPPIYSGMELSGWQNLYITNIVGSFSERGNEFVDYRNNFVKKEGFSKTLI